MLTIAQTLLALSQNAQRQRPPEPAPPAAAEAVMRSRELLRCEVMEKVKKNLLVLFELRFGATLLQAAMDGRQYADLFIAEIESNGQYHLDGEVLDKLSDENRALVEYLPQFLEDQGFYCERKIDGYQDSDGMYRSLGKVPSVYKVSFLVRW